MRAQAIWTAALLTICTGAYGQTITERNSEKAQQVIEEVLEAFGGREAMQNLSTLQIESDSTGYAVGQSRAPGPPWDKNTSVSISAIDVVNSRFSGRNIDDPDRYRFDQGQIVGEEKAWQINYRSGTATPVAEPNFNQQSGPFVRITSTLLAHQLMQRSHTATYLGETVYKEKPHDVLSFVMEVGPAISLYVDKDTHLISKSERVLPNFGLVEYEFRDYRTVKGIKANHSYTFYFQGSPNDVRQHRKIVVNQPIDDLMSLPKGIKKQKPPAPNELASKKIADGVYLIGGQGTYALFVEMDDHVIAVGGTGGSEERIEMLRKSIPDKPIKFGIFTHHHSDHVLAAPSYVEAGATLVAHSSHEQVIRTAAGDETDVKMNTLSGARTFSDGKREILIVDLGPTEHAEHILAAYLPKERVLFSADHFGLPASGPVAPGNTVTREFADAIEREKLDVKTLLSAHSPKPATMKHLRKALSSKPKFRNSF